jgi:hypothetical protein
MPENMLMNKNHKVRYASQTSLPSNNWLQSLNQFLVQSATKLRLRPFQVMGVYMQEGCILEHICCCVSNFSISVAWALYKCQINLTTIEQCLGI